MVDSATQRTQERRAQLGARARALAVERGFHGFTIDELCDDIGVSRRTFFNYFPTKEQAVLGRPEEGLEGEALERFLAGGGARGTLSPTLLDGLVDLAVEHFEGIGLTPDGAQQLFALLEREPKLFTALMQAGSERDRLLERLSAQREGVAQEDPRIRLAVQLVGTLARHAVEESLAHPEGPPFEAVLRSRLELARTLLAPAPAPAPAPEPEPEKDR